jgi:sugar phosphate isomerase/epimerase
MIFSGLVSVTFRKLKPYEIIELVKKTELQAIEWGGDIHIPHGNYSEAKIVRKQSDAAGIKIASYGSYYHAYESKNMGLSFETVLNTALELGTPNIRVWAGKKGSDEADDEYRKIIIDDLQRIAEMAGKHDTTISLEFHRKTLTDTNESAFKLLKEIQHKNIYFYWQPPINQPIEYCVEGLQVLLPRITNIHIFYWTGKNDDLLRHPLIEGKEYWQYYIDILRLDRKDHFALLEFIKNDDPDQFLLDAKTLSNWLR